MTPRNVDYRRHTEPGRVSADCIVAGVRARSAVRLPRAAEPASALLRLRDERPRSRVGLLQRRMAGRATDGRLQAAACAVIKASRARRHSGSSSSDRRGSWRDYGVCPPILAHSGIRDGQRPSLFRPIWTFPRLWFSMRAVPVKTFSATTARRTPGPSRTCGWSSRNSQPRRRTVPPSASIAGIPCLSRSQDTNVQSPNPTVPVPAILAICRQGPQNAQLTNRMLPLFPPGPRSWSEMEALSRSSGSATAFSPGSRERI